MVEQTGTVLSGVAPGGVVFVSYSREDAEWRRRFVGMLKPVVRERRLEVWSDERIVVGEPWRPELADAIRRSQLALLLVSRDFLASDFIMQQELPALTEEGVRLVCVLVRPCLWEQDPTLRRVQWAHDPWRDGPVETSSDPEGQIVRVCKELLELLPPKAADGAPEAARGESAVLAAPAKQRAEAVSLEEGAGRLHDVPPLPSAFVGREELANLRAALLRASDGAVGITGKALGLHGQGGIGKTVLAVALAREEAVRRHFPDGVFWVSVGERGDIVAGQIDLLAQLGVAHSELRSATEGLALLREALADRQCLLVVDDVWSTAVAAAFRAVGPRGRVLYTTRDPAVLREIGADVEAVDVLPRPAARQLLATLTQTHADALPAETDWVLEATGRVALALALVGAAVARGGRTWREVAEELDEGGETFLDHPYADTFKAMQVGVAALDGKLAQAYRSLAVYPEDTLVPVAAVSRFWGRLWGLSAEETRAQLEVLDGRKLLSLDLDAIAFHGLQRDFLLLQTSDLSVLHADLLDAYGASAWRELPQQEPYIWEHLLHHLKGAGDAGGLRALVTDLGYLALRSFRSGPYAAETELREAAALYPDDALIAWLLRLFSQWGHLFANHPTVGDLAATLGSRTQDPPAPLKVDALAGLLPSQFLVPRWGLPSAAPALIRVLEGRGGLRAVAFSPDGRQLASAGIDGKVRLWDPASGQPTATLEGHARGVRAVAFSPDGRQLASAGFDEKVRLWDPIGGQPSATLEGHSGGVRAVAFSPDGRQLASAGGDGKVRLWDHAGGQPTATLEGHTGGVRAVAFSPDGRQLASAGGDKTVRLWDPIGGQPTATLEGHARGVRAVAFSPDGRQLASAGGDKTVRLWDPASGQPTATLEGHARGVRAVAFSPDGRQLASAGGDENVRLWDPASGQPTATLEGHTGEVGAVAFSPDGRQLASASFDETLRLWDPVGGQPTATLEGHSGLRAVAISPDGRQLASAGGDEKVRLWDHASGQPTATLEGHTGGLWALAFSPDGRQLASAGVDGNVRLWDPAGGQPTATLEGHSGGLWALAFSPDGLQLASAGGDKTVRLWDLAGGQPTATLGGHTGGVGAVAFSPDGRQLASAGVDGNVRLWDLARGEPTATLEGHTGGLRAVAFSPDGRQLASAGIDETLRLWDPASGQPTATLEGHTGGVRAVAFSPDGRQLASAGVDETVRLWNAQRAVAISLLKPGAELAALAWGPCGITVGTHTGVLQLGVMDRSAAPG